MAAFETKFPGVIAQQTPRFAGYRPALGAPSTMGAFVAAAPAARPVSVAAAPAARPVSVSAPYRPPALHVSVAPYRPPALHVSAAPYRPPAPAADEVTVLTDAEMRKLEAFARGAAGNARA